MRSREAQPQGDRAKGCLPCGEKSRAMNEPGDEWVVGEEGNGRRQYYVVSF